MGEQEVPPPGTHPSQSHEDLHGSGEEGTDTGAVWGNGVAPSKFPSKERERHHSLLAETLQHETRKTTKTNIYVGL